MIDSKIQENILQEFNDSHETYAALVIYLEGLVSELMKIEKLAIHSVNGRCKASQSLAGKIADPKKNYGKLADITDIVGIRITTYFSEDVDLAASIIRKEFVVDPINSIDKRQSLDPDRFGYQSLHFVASLSSVRSSMAECQRFKEMKFEIQIRSILQHAWAEIEHDLGYKLAEEVPKEIRRRFARVAGLLELADAEFVGIRSNLNSYAKNIPQEIEKSSSVVDLNLISLRALYVKNSHLKSLDDVLAEVAVVKIYDGIESLDGGLLSWLQRLDIFTVKTIEAIAKDLKEEVRSFSTYWFGDERHERLYTGIGLFYLIYVLLWKTQDKNLINEYCIASHFANPDEVTEKLLAYKS